MATEFFIHKMTEHMETARIIRWLVKEGDTVNQYQPVIEAETDKAVVDVEAPVAGVIKGIRPGAVDGAEVKVGETICYVAAPDEAVPILPPLGAGDTTPAKPAGPTASPAHVKGADREPGSSSTAGSVQAGSVQATPAARRVARELGVELGRVKGTGPNGIIREEDVRAYDSTTDHGR
jgi:pyruvate/2-oxoglutarate dehydrogenase complex dihydrolipoamide acyltransferase (E2) component